MVSARHPRIVSLVHTRNSAETLPRLLDSIAWVDARIVVDHGSSDRTLAIAREHQAVVHVVEETAPASARAIDLLGEVAYDWVLALGPDERLAVDAEPEVRRLVDVQGPHHDVFEFPRFTDIAGHIMRGPQWYPDWQPCLFRADALNSPGSALEPARPTATARRYRLEPPRCPHVHRLGGDTVRAFIQQRMQLALASQGPASDGRFDFDAYVGDAYRALADGYAEEDGELSYAVATVLAWEQVLRGLVHWDRLGRPSGLNRAFSLPLRTVPNTGSPVIDDAHVIAPMQMGETPPDDSRIAGRSRLTRALASSISRAGAALQRLGRGLTGGG